MSIIMHLLFDLILLLSLLVINHSTGAPIINDHSNSNEDETQTNLNNNQSSDGVQQCQRLMTYEEMRDLLAHSPCAFDRKDVNNTTKLRTKRDDPTTLTNNVYALQSTINDHRTIIDDHRQMIHYLMNNTVNITHLNQYYADQHTKTTPIWKSWRDVSLLLLIVIGFCAIVCFLVMRLHLLDVLTSILLRRYQNKQQQQQQPPNQTKKEKTIMRHKRKDLDSSKITTIPISNIQREYMRYQHGASNSSLQD